MATPIWLTDEDSDIVGYKRAKVPVAPTKPNRSDTPSLVRVSTPTVGGAANISVIRKVGSQSFANGWITDPLNGPGLTATAWELHIWAMQTLTTHVSLDVEVYRFTNQEADHILGQVSSALPIVMRDVAVTGVIPTPVQLAIGDRLVIKLSGSEDSGGAAGGSFTVSYNGMKSRAEGDSYLLCPDNFTANYDLPDDDILEIRQDLADAGSANPQLSDAEIIRWFKQAIETYSVDRPRQVGYYYSGDGASQDYPLPPQWIWGLSRIDSLEYPADAFPAAILDPQVDFEVRENMLGVQPIRFLRFRNFLPDLGTNNIWVQYITRHSYSSEYSTIPVEDLDAVKWLAASYAASSLSSKGAGVTDSTIVGDAVNYSGMQRRWAEIASQFKKMYHDRVIAPDSNPVGFTEQWKPVLQTGTNFLWHSRRVRRIS